MFGLAVMGAGLLYLIICIVVVWLTIKYTKKYRWEFRLVWGLVALILYNIPLGYQIVPAGIVRRYSCQTKAGFWLYKTPEQWKQENPGVAETLTAYKNAKSDTVKHPDAKYEGDFDKTRIYHLNDRFDWVVDYRYVVKNLVKEELTVVDIQTNEVMAREIDYRQEAFMLGQGLSSGCTKKKGSDRWYINGVGFYKIETFFQRIGETE